MFCNFISPVLEKTPESSLDSEDIKPVNRKGSQPWILIGRTDAEPEAPILWQPNVNSPWCWERLRAEGEEGIRGWDGLTASLIQWTWTWASSRRWWRTGRPGVLQSMGSQRGRHDWVPEQHNTIKVSKQNARTYHPYSPLKWNNISKL